MRESRSIEEVADSIILIHRPDIQGLSECLEDREACCFIVAKNRNGECTTISLNFRSENTTFLSIQKDIEAGSLSESAPEYDQKVADKYRATPEEMNERFGDLEADAKANMNQ